MNRTTHLWSVLGWVLVSLGLTFVFPTSVKAQQVQVKPRILIIFDTSGSMNFELTSENSTSGDGSWDPWDSDDNPPWDPDRYCCPGIGGSRMYAAKEAMSQMIYATGDIDFALMKYAQEYDNSGINASYYASNQHDFGVDTLRYNGNGCYSFVSYGNDYDYEWLCTEFPAADEDNRPALLMWMDHHEYKSDGSGDADDAPFGVTPRSGDGLEQELRSVAGTPLAESMNSAETYLEDVFYDDYTDDPDIAWCRPYSVIILTDGDETCGGNIGTASTNLHTLEPGGGAPDKTVSIYVIGLSTSTTNLNTIASNGGTGSAIPASSEEDLSEALYDIISDSLLLETCNYIDDDCDTETDEDFRLPNSDTYCDPCGFIEDAVSAGVSPTDPEADLEDRKLVCEMPIECKCDGVDDNCDGRTDEGDWTSRIDSPDDREDEYLGVACGGCDLGSELCPTGDPDEGVCEQGTRYCAPGCSDPDSTYDCWKCAGDIQPVSEICDGVDNDCDGIATASQTKMRIRTIHWVMVRAGWPRSVSPAPIIRETRPGASASTFAITARLFVTTS